VKVFRTAAVIALLTGPAYAQAPELIYKFDSKTPQQKTDDELKEKFSKEAPKKIPEADAKTSVDPWGNVRSGDAAKTATAKTSGSKISGSKISGSKTSGSKTSNSKTANSVKPRTKAGTDAN
jgi:hypothetical protein